MVKVESYRGGRFFFFSLDNENNSKLVHSIDVVVTSVVLMKPKLLQGYFFHGVQNIPPFQYSTR